MISVVFFLISVSVLASGQNNESDFLTISLEPTVFFNIQSYKDKICNNEPTCKLINSATPKEYTTLEHRNCMCDADCTKYGDCCLDSNYYNETVQKQELFRNYHCSFQESIYMITSCPNKYNDIAIRNKCEKSTLPLDNDDITLIIPATNVNTRITYGNKYCAQCHGERNYRLWNETRYCSVKQTENIRPDDFQQNYPVANLDNDTSSSVSKLPSYRLENLADLTQNNTSLSETNDLFDESLEAAKYVKFNSTSKTFYSFFNKRDFSCSVGRIIPEELESSVRRCKRFVSECSDLSDKTLIERCRSYTSIVFYDYSSYRNKECAACNGVKSGLTGCFSDISYAPGSSLFSTNNRVAGTYNPCKDPALKEKFC